MKKLVAYHLVTILPMMIVMQLFLYDYIGWGNFFVLFVLYFFVYRPVWDYRRLKSKGLVNREEFVKSWGFIRFKYVQELMFKK
ncbi:hypothetical protein IFO69_05920 [Echinicola sp. CAU 1574]|uniref:ATP synthase F0 subunit 8 n=1 Tax=Echinicola arenosa TaxID=2774144 RepID=A0ABR9AHE8_9BACT|nr:hypothetical protein [Echinicola arenosa]MBD8488277.1 hypothetical protein [Echinicola arenosa]